MEFLAKMGVKSGGNYEPDSKDLLILEHLEKDAGMTTKKLAATLGMPQTTVHNRVRKLKQRGIIQKYVAILDHKKLGKALTAYVLLDIDYMNHDELFRKLSNTPSVREVSAVTGSNDIIMKVRAKNAEELGEIVLKNLRRMGGVTRTETMLVLDSVK